MISNFSVFLYFNRSRPNTGTCTHHPLAHLTSKSRLVTKSDCTFSPSHTQIPYLHISPTPPHYPLPLTLPPLQLPGRMLEIIRPEVALHHGPKVHVQDPRTPHVTRALAPLEIRGTAAHRDVVFDLRAGARECASQRVLVDTSACTHTRRYTCSKAAAIDTPNRHIPCSRRSRSKTPACTYPARCGPADSHCLRT
jgi:hypothetical protein